MSCASCAGRVERAVRALPGVETADVNLAMKTLRVEFGDGTDAKAVAEAVTRAGYAIESEDTRAHRRGDELRLLRRPGRAGAESLSRRHRGRGEPRGRRGGRAPFRRRGEPVRACRRGDQGRLHGGAGKGDHARHRRPPRRGGGRVAARVPRRADADAAGLHPRHGRPRDPRLPRADRRDHRRADQPADPVRADHRGPAGAGPAVPDPRLSDAAARRAGHELAGRARRHRRLGLFDRRHLRPRRCCPQAAPRSISRPRR